MLKNFIFIEDGRVDAENLRKLTDNTGAKIIVYRQGSPKPELVSVEYSENVKNQDIFLEEVKHAFLKALADYLRETAREETTSEELHYDYQILRMPDSFRTIYPGSIYEFMQHFERRLEKFIKG